MQNVILNRSRIMNKKVFISSDMEGVAGVSNWDEVDRKHNDYPHISTIPVFLQALQHHCKIFVDKREPFYQRYANILYS